MPNGNVDPRTAPTVPFVEGQTPDIGAPMGTPTVPPSGEVPPDLGSSAAPSVGGPMGQPPRPELPRESFTQGMARGAGGEQYAVDEQGNMVSARATRPSVKGTFGAILAGALIGAMHGAGATTQPGQDPVGAGFEAQQVASERQDLLSRQQAQQDFKNREQAQKSKDEHLRYQGEIAVNNLQQIRLAHEMEQAKINDPLVHQQLRNAVASSQLEYEKNAAALGLANPREYYDYGSIPQTDIDKFNRHEVKVTTSLGKEVTGEAGLKEAVATGTGVRVWDRTFNAKSTPNTEPFEIRSITGFDAKGRPQWKTVGKVEAGKGTVAMHEAQLDHEAKQMIDWGLKNAQMEKDRAQTAEAYAKAGEARAKTGEVVKDIDIAARALIEPRNLTSLRDISSMRNSERLKIFARAKELDPNFSPGLINQRVNFLKSYEDPKGRAAINRQSINNILQHAGDLLDVNQQFKNRGEVRVLNTAVNKIAKQFGSTAFVNYATTVGVLKDELALYFAGGYAPVGEQHAMWDNIVSNEATPKQIEAFAKEIVHLGLRRASTFNSQFRKNMGYDDPNMIIPEAYNAGEKLGLGNELKKFESGGELVGAGAGGPAPGRTAAPAAPAGATGIAPGSDGKRHYHDAQGKDLGVAP